MICWTDKSKNTYWICKLEFIFKKLKSAKVNKNHSKYYISLLLCFGFVCYLISIKMSSNGLYKCSTYVGTMNETGAIRMWNLF